MDLLGPSCAKLQVRWVLRDFCSQLQVRWLVRDLPGFFGAQLQVRWFLRDLPGLSYAQLQVRWLFKALNAWLTIRHKFKFNYLNNFLICFFQFHS